MDIALCINYNCPVRSNCLRYKAAGKENMQAFGVFTYDPKKGCDYFWNDQGWDKLTLMSTSDADRRAKRMS